MKEFKIDLSGYDGKVREVVSEAIQRHAFELGYPGWLCGGMQPKYTMCPFLYIENDCMLRNDEAVHRDTFNRCKNTLISAADFLALTPEDVRAVPKEPEFKPFDRVLVRDFDDGVWIPHFYSHRDGTLHFIHRTLTGVGYHHCIPYEGNEHLLGTTEDVK